MNNSYHDVTSKIEKMRELGVEPDNSVIEALREINTPHYKAAFVGKFQVGKTHIINKIFLNDENLLAEGIGLCKTAVTVEINHGDNKQFSYCNGNQIDVVTNPGCETISKVTAATDDEGRQELFCNVENAVLSYPNELLQNVSIYDTPGIDDPNEELLRETTYKLLPTVDMAVMVVAPKALSQVELRFLQKKVFSCGISNFMIVVSCKPTDNCSEEDEAELLEYIQNQLRSIGRADLPVYFYREDESGMPLSGEKNLAEVIMENAKHFTLDNRCNKLYKAISAQLYNEIERLKIESSVHGKTQAELIRMRSEAIQALNELGQEIFELQNEFNIRLSQQKTICVHGFEADLKAAQEKFIARLKEADGLGEAQDILNKADSDFQQEVEDIIVTRMHGFYDAANKLVNEMKGDLKKRWKESPCSAMIREIDGGRVQKWNSTLVTFGDYFLSGLLLPGTFFLSIGLRFILGKIPGVKNLMPSNLVKGYMVGVAEDSLAKQLPHLIAEFGEHIANEQKKIGDFIAEANRKEMDRQKSLLDAIADKEYKADAEFDAEAVRKKINELGSLLEQLA